MKFCAYYKGKRIPYLLGILIGLDIALSAFVPGAHVTRTASERLGRKRIRLALRAGKIVEADVYDQSGRLRAFRSMSWPVQLQLINTPIPFRRHPLAALIDAGLERIDENHSLEDAGG